MAFPEGMEIRRGPSMGEMPVMPVQQGMAGDLAQVAGQVGGEISNYVEQEQTREAQIAKMVEKRKLAMEIQAAKDEMHRTDAEFKKAQAEEATRQFEAREKGRDRDAKRKELADAADVKHKDEGRALQKDRDKSLAEHRKNLLAQKKAGGSSRGPRLSTKGYGGNTRRVLENIENGIIDEYEASEQNTARISKLKEKLDTIRTEESEFGEGTEGKVTEKGGTWSNWFEDTESDTDRGLLDQENRSNSNKKMMQRIEKELEDREQLDSMIGDVDNIDLDGGSNQPAYNPGTSTQATSSGQPAPQGFQGQVFGTRGQLKAAVESGQIPRGTAVWVEEDGKQLTYR